MKTIEQRVRDWQEVVAKIDDAPDQRYHAGRLAGISESLSIAQRYTRELEELHGVDGCSTGDCPHDNVNDCVKSQAEDIAQQAKHIATLTARLAEAESRCNRLHAFCVAVCPGGVGDTYNGDTGRMFATLAAKDRKRMADRIVAIEEMAWRVRRELRHHERCPCFANSKATCDCSAQDTIDVIDAALASPAKPETKGEG